MQTYILLLVAMAALFYFMILRPQQRAKRAKAALMDALAVGSRILTVGGIHGVVVGLREDDLDLEIAPGVLMRLDRRAVATVVPFDPDDANVVEDEAMEFDDADDADDADQGRTA